MTKPTLDIVATIGPASRSIAVGLRDAGASALRVNASHVSPSELERMVLDCRASVPGMRIIIDLKGAKMRVGEFAPRSFAEGERLRFALYAIGDDVPLPHPEIFSAVCPGDTLGCDDDRLRFRVLTAAADTIETRSLCAGILQPRKGVNVLEHPLHLDRLTDSDKAAIDATSAMSPVSYAFSFMEDGREAGWIREYAPGCMVIGKVERREAVHNFEQIAGSVDVLWICRGDLGAQLGMPDMARWVASVEPTRYSLPVLMAGQVFEHLTEHAAPTRAEICHVFDLSRRGYAGFVLSDETAIGKDPVGAVRTLRTLLDSFR